MGPPDGANGVRVSAGITQALLAGRVGLGKHLGQAARHPACKRRGMAKPPFPRQRSATGRGAMLRGLRFILQSGLRG